MIFYFSGTGNSLYSAKFIAESVGDDYANIAVLMNDSDFDFTYSLKDNEAIGFVFPLYAWSAPKMVMDFIRKVEFQNYNGNYTFAVATYGQNIGRFDEFIKEVLPFKLNSAFTLNMPNNFIMIWDRAKQDACLHNADLRLEYISDIVAQRKDVRDVETVLNGVRAPEGPGEQIGRSVNQSFNATLHDVSKFYVTDDCTGCKLCSSVCNGQTISYIDNKPVWGNSCTKCFACLHLCAKRAIQYGEVTETAGRYKNPNVGIDELKVFR